MASTADIARRCIDDPDFARTVLNGVDHPEVREALLADLAEGPEVAGYFNPQPMPPGDKARVESINLPDVSAQWGSLNFTHLKALAGR